ncbi:hypothetical protein RDABS01_024099, partial [Bienertia sinuspersici]
MAELRRILLRIYVKKWIESWQDRNPNSYHWRDGNFGPIYTLKHDSLLDANGEDSSNHLKVHLISWETLQQPRTKGGLGFKSMRQTNAAFLAKMGWRMLSEPNSLRSRVLRSKYCQVRCDVDMFQAKTNCSNLWRGIVENVSILRQGVQANVRNGKTTLFFYHKWVVNQPLDEVAIKEIPNNILRATVEEMWDNNSGWKWEAFEEYLPLCILKKIQFTIISAISLLQHTQGPQEDPHWGLIWSASTQNKVKFFLWLVMHNRILCNENRHKRGL